jgi:spoIIIJ-associated protein
VADDAEQVVAEHDVTDSVDATDAAGAGDGAESPVDAAAAESAEPAGGDDALSVLEHEGEVAADYLEALLDILDMDGDLDLDIEGDRASVAIVGDDLNALIGPRGSTLEALQELTRLAVLQETGQRSRLMLDIGGYRIQRRTELVALAKAAGERVAGNGQDERLAPMTPFERKVVHDTIATIDGVVSESEGEEPQRRVVLRPE